MAMQGTDIPVIQGISQLILYLFTCQPRSYGYQVRVHGVMYYGYYSRADQVWCLNKSLWCIHLFLELTLLKQGCACIAIMRRLGWEE